MSVTVAPESLVRSPAIRTEDERALVAGILADRDAFAPLYERYVARVYAYLRGRTGNADDAADLTQQVFLRAFAALRHYRQTYAPFTAWLFRIAANAATDHERRRRRLAPLTLAEDLPTDADGPETRALHAEDVRALRVLVRGLSASDRELLALRFAGGLRTREIARIVGRSDQAVRKQLWRIIQRLKAHSRSNEHQGVTT